MEQLSIFSESRSGAKKIEFGDFQTPLRLAERCVALIAGFFQPKCVIEPTCGFGNFIEASYNLWGGQLPIFGYEIHGEYIDQLRERRPDIYEKSSIVQADFFALNLQDILSGHESPLIVGNPPWVTNSQLGHLNSQNLPQKSNFKGYTGFEALSGKSNFDISEWMLIQMSEIVAAKNGVLAMLCKTQVARNVFLHNSRSNIKNAEYKMFLIDSKKEFGVSVEACFFVIDFHKGGTGSRCDIFTDLDLGAYSRTIGIADNRIVANLEKYLATREQVAGESTIIWRSGIKHDAASIMELKVAGDRFINGLNQEVDIEEEHLFPLLKSSDLANNRLEPLRYMIVPQMKVGENTNILAEKAPKLWAYLNSNAGLLDKRRSSIYTKQPRFSIFGIGEYSFKPFKIGISGLYKRVNFCLLAPHNGKPIVLDDTCYLLGFDNLDETKRILNILNSKLVQDYIESLIFWDAKRPINSDILKSIDLLKAGKNLEIKGAA